VRTEGAFHGSQWPESEDKMDAEMRHPKRWLGRTEIIPSGRAATVFGTGARCRLGLKPIFRYLEGMVLWRPIRLSAYAGSGLATLELQSGNRRPMSRVRG